MLNLRSNYLTLTLDKKLAQGFNLMAFSLIGFARACFLEQGEFAYVIAGDYSQLSRVEVI